MGIEITGWLDSEAMNPVRVDRWTPTRRRCAASGRREIRGGRACILAEVIYLALVDRSGGRARGHCVAGC